MTKGKKLEILLVAAIFALGIFFRFWKITAIPPGLYPDEAINGTNGLQALATGNFQAFYPDNNGREGLFINIQALSVKVFGNTAGALRIVSTIFGSLTILGIYLAAKELFRDRKSEEKSFGGLAPQSIIALLSTFFLATSYWHVNFSRIGFRAITAPFFAVYAVYFLLKSFRKGTILDMALSGVFLGLGLNGYIAFRFMPFVLGVPFLLALWKWWKEKPLLELNGTRAFCVPCAAILFAIVVLVCITPLILYFLQHPEDLISRQTQVSIFSAASPIKEFLRSTFLTLQMFFFVGDCNPRHNFPCFPELNPLVAIAFLVGFISISKEIIRKKTDFSIPLYTIIGWFGFMLFPVVLTREGIPHALRSIGMLPAIMIISGFGCWIILQKTSSWVAEQKAKWPAFLRQLNRIEKELILLLALLLLSIPVITFILYFQIWPSRPSTSTAFTENLSSLSSYLNTLPSDYKKYIVTDWDSYDNPISAQPIVFLTNTAAPQDREKKHFMYIPHREPEKQIRIIPGDSVVIVFLENNNVSLMRRLRSAFPQLNIHLTPDFIYFANF